MEEHVKTIAESILAFAFVLGILIFIHEFGHFIMARLLKIRVKVFSFGFGYRLFGRTIGDTDYRVSLIPLGGYVKLAGEEPDEFDPSDKNHFLSRPKYQRFFVIVMGATFNIVLALLLTTFVYMHGIEAPALSGGPPVVDLVEEGSPAANIDIKPGDRIMEIDGQPVRSLSDFTQSVFLRPNTTAQVRIERGVTMLEKSLEIIENPHSRYREGYTGLFFRIPYQIVSLVKGQPAEKSGLQIKDRIIGIDGERIDDFQNLISKIQSSPGKALNFMIKRNGTIFEKEIVPIDEEGRGIIGAGFGIATELIKKNLPEAFGESLRFAYTNMTLIYTTIKNLIRGDLSFRVFSGPIEIASFSGETYRQGPIYFIYFIALVSLQLGIVNLLPLPILDGGHILILIIESIIRRDFNVRLKEIIIQVGFVFLLVLTGVIIYYDIIKNFFS